MKLSISLLAAALLIGCASAPKPAPQEPADIITYDLTLDLNRMSCKGEKIETVELSERGVLQLSHPGSIIIFTSDSRTPMSFTPTYWDGHGFEAEYTEAMNTIGEVYFRYRLYGMAVGTEVFGELAEIYVKDDVVLCIETWHFTGHRR